MSFGGLILTNRGRNLQSKAQTGVLLQYTRIGIGDGYLGTTPILDLNVLKNQVKTLNIIKLKNLGNGRAVVGTVLSNQDMVEGFYFREIGVFAQDPDLGEILYCYGNAGELAEYISPGGGADIIEKSIDIQTIIGNAQNISAVIDESLVWETVEGAIEKTNIVLAVSKDYTDQEIGGKTIDDTLVPSTDTGLSVKILLSWLANMIKSITGKSSWRTKPTKNLEQLNTTIDEHKAESTVQIIRAARDATLVGTQTITTTSKPKSIRINAWTSTTKKVSLGFYGQLGGQRSVYQDGTNEYWYDGVNFGVVMQNSNGAATRGTIQNITATGFDIVWDFGGTGATGTITMNIEVSYHGEG